MAHKYVMHDVPRAPRVTDEDISAIIEIAEAHEISVYRRLLSLPVRGRVAARIDRCIELRLTEAIPAGVLRTG